MLKKVDEAEQDSIAEEKVNASALTGSKIMQAEESEEELTGTLSNLCQHRTLRTNLIIMAIVWSFGSFAFFLVPYYLNQMKANIYYLSLAIECGEFLGSVICVFIARLIDLRRALFICCMIITLGCISMIFVTQAEDDKVGKPDMMDNLLPTGLIMLTNLGVVISFDVAYLINADIFPTIVLATAYGVCNVFSRFITITSPMAAKITAPIPLILLASFALVCGFLSWFLKKK